jgi:hypothetical protein
MMKINYLMMLLMILRIIRAGLKVSLNFFHEFLRRHNFKKLVSAAAFLIGLSAPSSKCGTNILYKKIACTTLQLLEKSGNHSLNSILATLVLKISCPQQHYGRSGDVRVSFSIFFLFS